MGFQDRQDKIMDFMTKHDIESSVGYDQRNKIARQYGIVYGAGVILVNREGIVTARMNRGITEKRLVSAINEAASGTAEQTGWK